MRLLYALTDLSRCGAANVLVWCMCRCFPPFTCVFSWIFLNAKYNICKIARLVGWSVGRLVAWLFVHLECHLDKWFALHLLYINILTSMHVCVCVRFICQLLYFSFSYTMRFSVRARLVRSAAQIQWSTKLDRVQQHVSTFWLIHMNRFGWRVNNW